MAGRAVRRRHERSFEFDDSSVEKEGNHWLVESSTGTTTYTVEFVPGKENCFCKLRCRDCSACYHMFTCTCPDYELSRMMCKHVHKVCRVKAMKPSPFKEPVEPDHSYARKFKTELLDEFSDSSCSVDPDLEDLELQARCKRGRDYWEFDPLVRRHNRSLYMEDEIVQAEDDHWLVESSKGDEMYTVELMPEGKLCNCLKWCNDCSACYHMYSCTCPDYGKGYMCKHIHTVCRVRAKSVNVHLIALQRRHRKSLDMEDEIVEKKCDYWLVESSSGESTYTVEPLPGGKHCTCTLQCQECSACQHMYSCTCPDYTKNNIMCKHIHVVCRVRRKDLIEPEHSYAQQIETSHDSSFYNLDEWEQQEMSKRHGRSLLVEDEIIKKEGDHWLVESSRHETMYIVELTRGKKNCLCSKRCNICQTCYHMYSCTCPDYGKGYMCKHIHAVCRVTANNMDSYDNRIKYLKKQDSLHISECRGIEDLEVLGSLSEEQSMSWKLEVLYRRHNMSREVGEIVEMVDNYWLIQSAFIVKPIPGKEKCKCTSRCQECLACYHMYSCTCPDYNKNNNMCKHIHAVCQVRSKKLDVSNKLNMQDSFHAPSNQLNVQFFASRQPPETEVSSKIKMLHRRHEKSLQIEDNCVQKTGNRWVIESFSSDNVYIIMPERDKENCMCALQCTDCMACYHMFSCTCQDYSLNYNMCKHIHKICRMMKKKDPIEVKDYFEASDNHMDIIDLTSVSDDFADDTDNMDFIDLTNETS